MTRINFYILESHDETSRLTFCCQLIEKALAQQNRIMILATDQAEAESIDDLLWSFRPESYIPHTIVTGPSLEAPDETPVIISAEQAYETHQDVLVNLSSTLPQNFAQFKRLAQIVNQDNTRLAASRRNFTFLRENGHAIEVNKLKR